MKKRSCRVCMADICSSMVMRLWPLDDGCLTLGHEDMTGKDPVVVEVVRPPSNLGYIHPFVTATWSFQTEFKAVHFSLWKAFAGAIHLTSVHLSSFQPTKNNHPKITIFNTWTKSQDPIPGSDADLRPRTKMQSRNERSWWNAPEVLKGLGGSWDPKSWMAWKTGVVIYVP